MTAVESRAMNKYDGRFDGGFSIWQSFAAVFFGMIAGNTPQPVDLSPVIAEIRRELRPLDSKDGFTGLSVEVEEADSLVALLDMPMQSLSHTERLQLRTRLREIGRASDVRVRLEFLA